VMAWVTGDSPFTRAGLALYHAESPLRKLNVIASGSQCGSGAFFLLQCQTSLRQGYLGLIHAPQELRLIADEGGLRASSQRQPLLPVRFS